MIAVSRMNLVHCVSAFHTNGAAIPLKIPPAKRGGGGDGGIEKKAAERITINPNKDDRKDDRKVERLRRWLHSLGHDDCNLRLEKWIRNSDAAGYGMVAGPGGINRSDVIVRVPKEALMTEEVALSLPCFLIRASRLTLSGSKGINVIFL
jgi:hypothetical protein